MQDLFYLTSTYLEFHAPLGAPHIFLQFSVKRCNAKTSQHFLFLFICAEKCVLCVRVLFGYSAAVKARRLCFF